MPQYYLNKKKNLREKGITFLLFLFIKKFLAMFHHTQNLSSPTMDRTRMSCVRSAVLITGPPGKELHFLRES